MEDSEETRRADDSLLRKVAVGILITFFVQAGGWVYMLGSLTNQVENNTKTIEAIMGIVEKQGDANTSMIRVETLVEGLTTLINRLSDRLETVANEQNRRALIIDRADRYMEKNGGG